MGLSGKSFRHPFKNMFLSPNDAPAKTRPHLGPGASVKRKRLGRGFYERDTRIAAFELIGKTLVWDQAGEHLSGIIVETEAYLGSNDPASHAYRGPTPRAKIMFGPAGMSYVYFTYGFHYCFNVVTEKDGAAGAVLIRALEPVHGTELMKKRRKTENLRELTSGPAKLTQAFGMTTAQSGFDLTSGDLYIEEENASNQPFTRIGVSKRIGIRQAADSLYRFYVEDSEFVSRKKV